ncbi:alpha/beta hydrolase [Nocardiopsis tropica]|uniref:Alpha/beta hydrolase n=1 Tax=Nocardiopsis tropica TaxID=109330 RepID=A0ABU7KY34_9ACTN|nr:alpha/beta hydrolase [Nocardiopsis umidischolae]MEE2054223.1 alpha/beta hydrolase [Nocardiopsis umidischolae]
MRRARTIPLAASVLTAALTTSLAAASPAAADPAAPAPADTALAAFHDQDVTWAPCTEAELPGLECADVEVPLDYADPGGTRITVAVSRGTADDAERRRGILLTNPGGPGGHGRTVPLSLADNPEAGWALGDTRAAEVYDIIGMDPRGTGASSPRVDCGADPMPFFTRPTDAEFSALTRAAIDYQRTCERTRGDLLPHMSTANTARDMDVIRAALGEDTLNYLGGSYGTYLGAVYGTLFPERMDRSVLDSPTRPEGVSRDALMGQAPAYSANMDRYAAWLAEHDDLYGFGATAEEVRETLDATSARLREEPLGEDSPMPGYENNFFDMDIGFHARFQDAWDLFASFQWFLVNDEPLPEGYENLSIVYGPVVGDTFTPDLQTAVLCETEWPARLGVYREDTRVYREEHPYGSGAGWAAPYPCAFSTVDRPEPAVDAERDGYPQGLVIAGELDANTPYEDGVAMAERLDNPLVTVAGDGGHGFYHSFGLPCVRDAVDAYLVDGEAPADVTCQGLPPAEPAPAAETAEAFAQDPAEPVAPLLLPATGGAGV